MTTQAEDLKRRANYLIDYWTSEAEKRRETARMSTLRARELGGLDASFLHDALARCLDNCANALRSELDEFDSNQ